MTATRRSPRRNPDEAGRDLPVPGRTAGARNSHAPRMRGTSSPALGATRNQTLSGRAHNVLKELAVELTGEQPPRGSWIPGRDLLLALSAERLATARNCGPHTMREIIGWAKSRGVTIRPLLQAKSLSQMWANLVEKAADGALTPAELAQALEKSIRRKSTRIPLAIQAALSKMLSIAD